jgi:hypothetical protein
MAVGEVAKVKHLAIAVLLLVTEAGPLGIDRHDGRGLPVEPVGAIVVANRTRSPTRNSSATSTKASATSALSARAASRTCVAVAPCAKWIVRT